MTLRPLLLSAAVAAGACAGEPPPPPEAPPPTPDIWLGTLSSGAAGVAVTGLHNATDRPGYDNQPHFTPDGTGMLYTSVRGDGQADIYRYDLGSGTIARVTQTAESEYSPTVMAGGTGFSAVTVEADSTQRLWAFGMDGVPLGVVFDSIAPVGYHAWADPTTVALFVLPTGADEPVTLRIADVATGIAEIVANDVGRSLHKVPARNAVSFVHKVADGDWWIKSLDLETGDISQIARTLDESEDYAWTQDGRLLMGRGSVLYVWDQVAGVWQEVADFQGSGLTDITRLAVDATNQRIALVALPTGSRNGAS